jgi:hypothetical protein
MIIVNDISDAEGQWLNNSVQVLAAPYFDASLQKWVALANAFGTLSLIELRVTPLDSSCND